MRKVITACALASALLWGCDDAEESPPGYDDAGGAEAGSDSGRSRDAATGMPDTGVHVHDAGGGGDDAGETGDDAGAMADASTMDAGGMPGLGAGPFAIAYAAPQIGADTQASVTATFGTGGGLESYMASVSEAPERGTLMHADVLGDATALLGRWSDGTLGGTYYSLTPPAWNDKQGYHYAIGNLTPVLPTSFDNVYLMQGATQPTAADGTTPLGQTTGNVKVDWSGVAPNIAMDVYVVFSGLASYHLVTTGGINDPTQSEITGGADGRFAGTVTLDQGSEDIAPACGASAGDCKAYVQGFFAGAQATHVALVLAIHEGSPGSTSAFGAALFKR